MAHTETMPKSGMSLEGHRLRIGEIASLSLEDLVKRHDEVRGYYDAGTEQRIIGWEQRAGRLLVHLQFEMTHRLNDREFTPEEVTEAVERLMGQTS